MTATVWPSTLPLPFIDYTGADRNTTLTSSFSDASIERRSRSSKTYSQIQVVWYLGEAELEAFKTFFETTLGNGVALFQIELRYPKNATLTNWAVRFIEGYQIEHNPAGGKRRIQATLDLLYKIEDFESDVADVEGWSQFQVADEIESEQYNPVFTSGGSEFYVKD